MWKRLRKHIPSGGLRATKAWGAGKSLGSSVDCHMWSGKCVPVAVIQKVKARFTHPSTLCPVYSRGHSVKDAVSIQEHSSQKPGQSTPPHPEIPVSKNLSITAEGR